PRPGGPSRSRGSPSVASRILLEIVPPVAGRGAPGGEDADPVASPRVGDDQDPPSEIPAQREPPLLVHGCELVPHRDGALVFEYGYRVREIHPTSPDIGAAFVRIPLESRDQTHCMYSRTQMQGVGRGNEGRWAATGMVAHV